MTVIPKIHFDNFTLLPCQKIEFTTSGLIALTVFKSWDTVQVACTSSAGVEIGKFNHNKNDDLPHDDDQCQNRFILAFLHKRLWSHLRYIHHHQNI